MASLCPELIIDQLCRPAVGPAVQKSRSPAVRSTLPTIRCLLAMISCYLLYLLFHSGLFLLHLLPGFPAQSGHSSALSHIYVLTGR